MPPMSVVRFRVRTNVYFFELMCLSHHIISTNLRMERGSNNYALGTSVVWFMGCILGFTALRNALGGPGGVCKWPARGNNALMLLRPCLSKNSIKEGKEQNSRTLTDTSGPPNQT